MLFLSRRVSLCIGFALLTALVSPSSKVFAQQTEKTNTVMTVSEMCAGCAKKITKRFEGVEGIAKVDCDTKKQIVTVIPKRGVKLSPRGIWEIMEGIKKAPQKMVCPTGTFTEKPKR